MKRILFILSLICLFMFVGCSNSSNNNSSSSSPSGAWEIEGDYIGTLTSATGASIIMGFYIEEDKGTSLETKVKIYYDNNNQLDESWPTLRKIGESEYSKSGKFHLIKESETRINVLEYVFQEKVYSGILEKQ